MPPPDDMQNMGRESGWDNKVRLRVSSLRLVLVRSFTTKRRAATS
jgi:hypothetical protein